MPIIQGSAPQQSGGSGSALAVMQILAQREQAARDAAFRNAQLEIQRQELAQNDRRLGIAEQLAPVQLSLVQSQASAAKSQQSAQQREVDAAQASTEGIASLGVQMALQLGHGEDVAIDIGNRLTKGQGNLNSIADFPDIGRAINEQIEARGGASERTSQELIQLRADRQVLDSMLRIQNVQSQLNERELRMVQITNDLAEARATGGMTESLMTDLSSVSGTLGTISKSIEDIERLNQDFIPLAISGEANIAQTAAHIKALADLSAEMEGSRRKLVTSLIRAMGNTSRMEQQLGAPDPEDEFPVDPNTPRSEFSRGGRQDPPETPEQSAPPAPDEVVPAGQTSVETISDSIIDGINRQNRLTRAPGAAIDDAQVDASIRAWMNSPQGASLPPHTQRQVVSRVRAKVRSSSSGPTVSTRNVGR